VSSLFGIEASRAVLFVVAFAIILALVALFGLVLRKLTGARLMMPGSDRSRSRQPRLGIVDVYDLDRQRQLLLLRRDNVEHLLLIGGPNDVVIETNIVRVAGARIPVAANEPGPERFEPAFDQASRPAQVEANGRPSIETQLAAQLDAFVRRPSSEESDVDQELSAVASVSAPVQARPEPALKPDTVSVSAAPAVSGLRPEARTAPSPGAPVTPPPVERPEPRPTFTPPPFQSRATPTAATPPAPPAPAEPVRPVPAAPVEKPAAPAVKAGPDAAVLSNMAKQLEEALKRPAATVAPAPAPAAYEPREEAIADEDDLLETPQAEEVRAEEARADERSEEKDLAEEPASAPEPEPSRPAAEPVRPAPSPLPPQRQESAPAPAAQKDKEPDPFSVEDIEAEFARLLGRPLDPTKRG
jgi:hypothetical protein